MTYWRQILLWIPPDLLATTTPDILATLSPTVPIGDTFSYWTYWRHFLQLDLLATDSQTLPPLQHNTFFSFKNP